MLLVLPSPKGMAVMRVLIVLCVMFSSSLLASPGDRPTKEERKKARIERRVQRRLHAWDERTQLEKRRDRKILFVMTIGAALIVKGLSGQE